MKNIVLITFISFFFLSCVEVQFKESQPINTKSLTEFPKELQGNYLIEFKDSINVLDTFIIGKNFFSEPTLSQQEPKSLKKDTYLSDSLVLKQVYENFTININEKDYWTVILLKPNGNGFDVFWIDGDNEETTEQLKRTTKVETIKDEDGKIDAYILNPKKKAFYKMIDNQQVFTKLYQLKKINTK